MFEILLKIGIIFLNAKLLFMNYEYVREWKLIMK